MGISKYDKDTLHVKPYVNGFYRPECKIGHVGLIKVIIFILDSWQTFVAHFKDFVKYSRKIFI